MTGSPDIPLEMFYWSFWRPHITERSPQLSPPFARNNGKLRISSWPKKVPLGLDFFGDKALLYTILFLFKELYTHYTHYKKNKILVNKRINIFKIKLTWYGTFDKNRHNFCYPQKSQVPMGLFWANWRCEVFHYSLRTVGKVKLLVLWCEAVKMTNKTSQEEYQGYLS